MNPLTRRRVLLSWSSGKDSAWTLKALRDDPDTEVVGLLTTVNAGNDRAAIADGVTHIAFGDLFLEDVRAYRIRQLEGSGLQSIFPIWGEPTPELARRMVDAGLEAIVTCVDPKQLPAEFVGRRFDHAFLDALPEGVDPCGENGEFHTCVTAGPMWPGRIELSVGERIERDGFCYADLVPTQS